MSFPLTTIGAEFPFNYLHAEMVKYYIERHNQYRAKKLKFLEQMRQDDDGMITDKDREIFTQLSMTSNAETRLESLGFRVGYSLVEKLSKDLPRFTTELEMMKFICKEFWTKAFGKQVDNLRTNHQDVYVVQDNKFLTVANLAEGNQYLKDAAIYLSFPAGVVRGALANLGIKCIVSPATESLPVVKFSIHLHKNQ